MHGHFIYICIYIIFIFVYIQYYIIYIIYIHVYRYKGLPRWHSGKESTYKRHGFDPWSGRSLGVGNGNPLQYFFLENPMDRGTLWAIVHGVTNSQM